MRRALEYVKAFDGVIAQHAQEPRLTDGAQMNEGVNSSLLGLTGWPAVAEEAIIARDCLLAAHVGGRLHVCHVSTAGSVELIRWAKGKGWDVTAEVTPHHLLLTDDCARRYDATFKVNPPLRTQADVDALREALADGTIDCVATDHAPHALEDKETEWGAAAMGMTGLETALSRRRPDHGRDRAAHLAPGRRPDERDPRPDRPARGPRPAARGRASRPTWSLSTPAARWAVDPAAMASRSRNTPFAGHDLPARVRATFLRGVAHGARRQARLMHRAPAHPRHARLSRPSSTP